MKKIALNDKKEIYVEDQSRIERIVVRIADFGKMGNLLECLSDLNLQMVTWDDGESVKTYNNMTIRLPHFTVTKLESGQLQVVFGLRKKTYEELIKENIQIAVSYLSDEQALTVMPLYPDWQPTGTYAGGDRRNYNGGLYKCLQSHTAQADWTPADSPSLWAPLLASDPETIPEWVQPDSTDGYSIGDKVYHNDKMWESVVDNNVWEPGFVGTESLWKEIK